MKSQFDECELCGRHTYLTFHHLIPRKLHRRNHFRKNYSKGALHAGIKLCRQCHSGVHRLYDEMMLAKHFYSRDLLLQDDAITRHVNWVKRQKVVPKE